MDQLLTNTFLQQVENKPILMVGPTASGKSKLALFLAKKLGRVIINADAIQIYENWRILTARPSVEDEQMVKHYLYGTLKILVTIGKKLILNKLLLLWQYPQQLAQDLKQAEHQQ